MISTKPIVIYTVQQLQAIQNNPSGWYVLGADINASGFTFTPISNFTGVLDGAGHTITGLTISGTTAPAPNTGLQLGLFGTIGASGVVENLTLANVSVTCTVDFSFVGGLAGTNNGTIEGVRITGVINNFGQSGVTGGLVGANNGLVAQSVSNASVSAVGQIDTGNENVGVDGLVGGLVGWNGQNGTGTITQSYATGPVTNVSDRSILIGGLVGLNGETLAAVYATGSVTSTGNMSGYYTQIGGLIGQDSGLSYAPGIVDQTYATGLIIGSANLLAIGGLEGTNFGTTTNSYWDTQTTGQSGSSGGAGLTTSQLQSGSLPSGFDPAIWVDLPGQFPELQWQVTSSHPIALPNVGTAKAGGTTTGNVLSNDRDPDGDTLTVYAVDGNPAQVGQSIAGTYGMFTLNSNGSYTYTAYSTAPKGAQDQFSYTVSDGGSGMATSAVIIDVGRQHHPGTKGSDWNAANLVVQAMASFNAQGGFNGGILDVQVEDMSKQTFLVGDPSHHR